MKAGVKKIFFLGLVLIFGLTLSGCGCKEKVVSYKVDLEIWGVADDSDTYDEIFSHYRKLNKNVGQIVYKKKNLSTYKTELIDAMASGKGPDIILIHNTWLVGFSDKIVPAPKEILNEQRYRKNFVDVCVADFVDKGEIFAVPLTVNSLALYYNKDLFNVAGITTPPKTWEEFEEAVVKLTRVDGFGEITQSGAAMGTAYNINRSTDIVSLLMFQSNVEMGNGSGGAAFADKAGARSALDFYTQFARTNSANYTWNPRMHYSSDAFSEGTLGMMINYSWQIPTIKSKAPKLNFAIADVPQFSQIAPANYANYWAYAVVGNKQIVNEGKSAPVTQEIRVKEAWKFLTYLTTKGEALPETEQKTVGGLGQTFDPNFDPTENYLKKTKQPAARRDLVENQKSDPELAPFAYGNLIAKSWKQSDPVAIEAILAEMIDQVNKGAANVSEALSRASSRINGLKK